MYGVICRKVAIPPAHWLVAAIFLGINTTVSRFPGFFLQVYPLITPYSPVSIRETCDNGRNYQYAWRSAGDKPAGRSRMRVYAIVAALYLVLFIAALDQTIIA